MVGFLRKQIFLFLIFVFVLDMGFKICFGHESHAHHHCSHGHDHGHHYHHPHDHEVNLVERKLPEELAEEEDLKLYGFESQNDHDNDHEHHTVNPGLSGVGKVEQLLFDLNWRLALFLSCLNSTLFSVVGGIDILRCDEPIRFFLVIA